MTDLTRLTIAEARRELARKEFSALEGCRRAPCWPMERARSLNAYVLETPERARSAAKEADQRLAAGKARPLDGIRSPSRTCSAPQACALRRRAAFSNRSCPPMNRPSANLWRDGAVLLGKTNNDEFAMGSSNETSAFGPGRLAVATRQYAAGAGGSSGGSAAAVAAFLAPGATGTDTGGSIRQPAAFTASSGSSRPTAVARGGGSSRSRPRSIRPAVRRARSATPRSCFAPWRA